MVHLHTRSCYSLLESPFRIEEIIDTAIEQGCTHVEFYVCHHDVLENGPG